MPFCELGVRDRNWIKRLRFRFFDKCIPCQRSSNEVEGNSRLAMMTVPLTPPRVKINFLL
jgi:hypothetical protein